MSIKIKSILKSLMHEKEITAAQLARATKIAPQTINNWLSGQEPRSLSQLKTVADHFEVSVDYLVYGNEEKKKGSMKQFEDEINAGIFEVVLRKVKK